MVTVISRWINAQINIRKRIDLRKIVFQSDITLLAVTGRVFKGDVWKFFCKINEMKVKKRKFAHHRTITSRINERFKQQKKQLRQITGNLDDKIPRRQTRSAGVKRCLCYLQRADSYFWLWCWRYVSNFNPYTPLLLIPCVHFRLRSPIRFF